MPEYTPAETDILPCFKITPRDSAPREEVAAAVAAESSIFTWATVWTDLLTELDYYKSLPDSTECSPQTVSTNRDALARRGKHTNKAAEEKIEQAPSQRHVAMTWVQRIKRVFNINIDICQSYDAMKFIACIEDSEVVNKVLTHLDSITSTTATAVLPE